MLSLQRTKDEAGRKPPFDGVHLQESVIMLKIDLPRAVRACVPYKEEKEHVNRY